MTSHWRTSLRSSINLRNLAVSPTRRCCTYSWTDAMKSNRSKASPARKGSKRISVPFRRQLEAIQKTCHQAISALDRGDPTRARITACRLSLAYLRMEAAFIRFVERAPGDIVLGPRARQERFVLKVSNWIARTVLRRVLAGMPSWNASPEALRDLREILCWLHERLWACSVVGFPDLSSSHALPFNPPRAGSHRPAGRRARNPMRKR